MTDSANVVVALRAEGVSLLIDVTAGQLPAIVHWGADLGPLELGDALALIAGGIEPSASNVVDDPVRLALLPEHWTGWVGRPGLSGSRGGPGLVTEVHLDRGTSGRGSGRQRFGRPHAGPGRDGQRRGGRRGRRGRARSARGHRAAGRAA